MIEIDGREFAGTTLGAGSYLARGQVSLWEEWQYVTTNALPTLLEPGYFNDLTKRIAVGARIHVASFVDDEWCVFTLNVTGNTYEAAKPWADGVVQVGLASRETI